MLQSARLSLIIFIGLGNAKYKNIWQKQFVKSQNFMFSCFTASEYNISIKVKPKRDNIKFTKTESASHSNHYGYFVFS